MQTNFGTAISGAISLIIILFIFISLFYFSRKLNLSDTLKIRSSKYIRILDKIALGSNNYLFIVQIGNCYFLISTTNTEIKIQKELKKDDLLEFKNSKMTFSEIFATKRSDKEKLKENNEREIPN